MAQAHAKEMTTEQLVIQEINKARQRPDLYIKTLETYKEGFKQDLKQKHLGGFSNTKEWIEDPKYRFDVKLGKAIVTNEGVTAVDEAIKFLGKQNKIDELSPNDKLSSAAKEHVDDQAPTEKTGHIGSNGSTMVSRVENQKYAYSSLAENIDYGSQDATNIVLSWIIDDGVESRGHRANLFDTKVTEVGVAFGSHKGYDYMCVADFAAPLSK